MRINLGYNMDKEKQRIAIAEACGWKDIRLIEFFNEEGGWTAPGGKRDYIQGMPNSYAPDGTEVPDYLSDLDAMHEAEKVLEDPQENGRLMATYCIWKLPAVCGIYTKANESSWAGSTMTYWLIHATAAQRAEAFLRTIGKWEE